MLTRRKFIAGGAMVAAAAYASGSRSLWGASVKNVQNPNELSRRPAVGERMFSSKAVEEVILRVSSEIRDEKLAAMFGNCFPNTLDTTVHYRLLEGRPDTFVYTGDIHAMWLRDSAAQVWPYLSLIRGDEELRMLIAGVINRHTRCILLDPYANAFNDGPTGGHWQSDLTDMKPELHERKWEIDSLCYPVRLAYHYWKLSGDTSVFDSAWQQAAALILQTFRQQQRLSGPGPYRFQRKTERQLDTLSNNGLGAPVRPVGLIASAFRPSDDATTYPFLIPSNLFAVASLKQLAEISEAVTLQADFARSCLALAAEVQKAINLYAVADHLRYGPIYAYEVDGFGNQLFMDDANVPSLLALPYLGSLDANDKVYQNTRRFVWSADNPYFFRGAAAEGIGGPHIGYDMIWPMSLTVRALTAANDDEIRYCLRTLRDTDARTGFIHEAFHKDDPANFTRPWFAWANTLFGELILKLYNDNKVHLLNSL